MNPIQGRQIKQQLQQKFETNCQKIRQQQELPIATVTLIYINMHVNLPRYCQGTAS